MKKMEQLMFAALGLGPLLTALFLIFNFYIHSSESTEVYRIDSIGYSSPYQYFNTEGLPCEEYPEFCKVHWDDIPLTRGKIVRITLAEGMFGYKVISDVQPE